MRLVVTRPQPDGERTAQALRARGHDVLLAPLLRIEPLAKDFRNGWGGVIITSAHAPAAITASASGKALFKLPLFAVGQRSAEAARQAGFIDVRSADGNVRDLVRLVAAWHASAATPLLYIAGEERAADLIAELMAQSIKAEMVVVYRAAAIPFPPELIAALKTHAVDGVLHFSRRSAEHYLTGAEAAGVLAQALRVGHFCLSEQIAASFAAARAHSIRVAARPNEAALIELIESARA